MMKSTFILCGTLLLAGCAIGLPTDYQGPDAGHAVIGIGATKDTHYNSYSLLFHRIDGQAPSKAMRDIGWLSYWESMITLQKTDYDDAAESGVVVTADLPPGRYEVFNFDVYNKGGVTVTYSAGRPFSIPFVIEPGKTVYLGNYQANAPRPDSRSGLQLRAPVTFVVENRQDRDMALARTHPGGASLSSVQNATPEVASIGSSQFQSRAAAQFPSPAAVLAQ